MKVIVCGGRRFGEEDPVERALLDRTLYRIHDGKGSRDRDSERRIRYLAHGGARGADWCAGEWAAAEDVTKIEYPADWDAYGKGAGPKRNQYMLEDFKPDLVVAFPGGRGTADMVRRAKKAGVEVMEVTAP